MKDAKEHYRLYLADDNLSELNKNLIQVALEQAPKSIFEFGAGTGKNLKFVQKLDSEIFVSGIDVSYINVIHAMVKNGLNHIALGDEQDLRHYTNFDVCITVSVLDHIVDIRSIVNELKRIANKAVVIAECIEHDADNYYYAHDYVKFGFTKVRGTERVSEGDGRQYVIYIWNKGAQDDLAK
jgi:2-polyprenyl-3-methyl-5-hydroxy-6-metoxy-1,4-benzoquinol methylase